MASPTLMSLEFLSYMIGAGRAGVNETVANLRDLGLLRNTRNRMKILDRTGLEKAACQCYAIVRREYGFQGAKLSQCMTFEGGFFFVPKAQS